MKRFVGDVGGGEVGVSDGEEAVCGGEGSWKPSCLTVVV
jgi:hypothetical protein